MTVRSKSLTILTEWELKVRSLLPSEIAAAAQQTLSLPLPGLDVEQSVYLHYMLYSYNIPDGRIEIINFPTHIITVDFPDFQAASIDSIPVDWADMATFFPVKTYIDLQNVYPMYHQYQWLGSIYDLVLTMFPQGPMPHTRELFEPLFFQVAPKALHSLYRDLCPEFWEWLSRDPEAIEAG